MTTTPLPAPLGDLLAAVPRTWDKTTPIMKRAGLEGMGKSGARLLFKLNILGLVERKVGPGASYRWRLKGGRARC